MSDAVRLSTEWNAVVAALGPHAHPGLSPSESVAQVVAEVGRLRGAIEIWQREAQSGWESARIAEAERNALMEDVQSTGKLWHDAEARAERAEAALKQIAAWSWDSGSTPEIGRASCRERVCHCV